MLLAILAAASVAGPPQGVSAEPAARVSPGGARTVEAARAVQPPVIDGRLDDPIWRTATPVSGFWKMRPVDDQPASERTEAWVAYDARNLYIAFHAYDDHPDLVRASLAPRDQVFDDDVVAVFLDTFHERRRGYLLAVNPLGVQGDEMVFNNAPDDATPDFVWKSAGRRTADGYVVEMAIPFKSLRFPNRSVQTWGIAFVRLVQHRTEQDIYPRVDANNNCLLCQTAALDGLAGIRSGRTVELLPEVTGRQSAGSPASGGPWGEGPVVGAFGLGAQVGITSNITANGTMNPDFSQVESDAGQVTVNQRFALFYPEKRPFFLEGSDIFKTPMQLVYTRTMFEPAGALKLTGKAGGTAIGVMSVADREPILPAGDTLPGGGRLPGGDAWFNVVRLRQDVGASSGVGVLATDREYGGTHNRVASLDGTLAFLGHWTATAQGAVSDTRNLDGRRQSDGALAADVQRSTLHTGFETWYNDYGPDFRADAGFIQRTDMREAGVFFGYSALPNGSVLLRWSPRIMYNRIYDHAGTLTDETVRPQLRFELARQTNAMLTFTHRLERFGGYPFHHNRIGIDVGTAPWTALSAEVAVEQGSAVEYDSTFLGWSRDVMVGVTLRPIEAFRFDGSLVKETFRRSSGGPQVYDVNIWRGKATWQFSRELFLRAISQWDTFGRTLDVNLLLSYTVSPGTVFFLGTDNGAAGPDGAVLHATGRTIFAKASYLWRW